ncbi:acetylcholine receptor subunit delta-like [Physella acuta]|uniref:acetylcholine receptor subunit delta-like n=1 Tax=Physella acuta TaxID=109671 RepID=UPI0027DC9ADF|nr:acetylcholine receptor subunit delta-like [Physella acuta]
MFTTQRINTVFTVLILLLKVYGSVEQEYSTTLDLFNEKLSGSNYNSKVRPLLNQSRILEVNVSFELLSIVELNDVQQSFTCNGFLAFYWTDELLVWNSTQYGGQRFIHPVPEDIWRPRVVVMNTLQDRDPFKDDISPVFVKYNGFVSWIPGSLFTISCELDLTDFPFDHQTCKIQLTFVMKRRPDFLLLNIILPVVLLSFLNLMVFVIPVDSGEKIGYGITVLLALTVYMSIVSNMLPSSSLSTPRLTLYLFILLIFSMLTVIDSIVIVFIDNLEEKEVAHLKAKANFRSALHYFTNFKTASNSTKRLAVNVPYPRGQQPIMDAQSHVEDINLQQVDPEDRQTKNHNSPKTMENKYRLIGKHIDLISFLVFFVIWLGVTFGFLFSIAF